MTSSPTLSHEKSAGPVTFSQPIPSNRVFVPGKIGRGKSIDLFATLSFINNNKETIKIKLINKIKIA